MRILALLGSGGHTAEVLQLIDQLSPDHEYQYVVGHFDPLSVDMIRRPGPVHQVHYPRAKTTGKPMATLGTLWNGVQSLRILARNRPDAVISAGPSVAVPALYVAKLLGIRVIHIETAARVRTVSVSGRLAYRVADLYVVQWPQLTERLPGAVYAGRLL